MTVESASFLGEVFSLPDDDWVRSAAPNLLLVNMSDDDWVQLTPRLAHEIIGKDRRWYLEEQRAPAPDDLVWSESDHDPYFRDEALSR